MSETTETGAGTSAFNVIKQDAPGPTPAPAPEGAGATQDAGSTSSPAPSSTTPVPPSDSPETPSPSPSSPGSSSIAGDVVRAGHVALVKFEHVMAFIERFAAEHPGLDRIFVQGLVEGAQALPATAGVATAIEAAPEVLTAIEHDVVDARAFSADGEGYWNAVSDAVRKAGTGKPTTLLGPDGEPQAVIAPPLWLAEQK